MCGRVLCALCLLLLVVPVRLWADEEELTYTGELGAGLQNEDNGNFAAADTHYCNAARLAEKDGEAFNHFKCYLYAGGACFKAKEYKKALTRYDTVLDDAAKYDTADGAEMLFYAQYQYGVACNALGTFARGLPHLQAAKALIEHHAEWARTPRDYDMRIQLGIAQLGDARDAEAGATFTTVEEMIDKPTKDTAEAYATCLYYQAQLAERAKKWDEAETAARTADGLVADFLGKDWPGRPRYLKARIDIFNDQQKRAALLPLGEELLGLLLAQHDADDPDVIGTRLYLAVAYFKEKQPDRVETHLKAAIAAMDAKPVRLEMVQALVTLATLYRQTGKPDAATPLETRAAELAKKLKGKK